MKIFNEMNLLFDCDPNKTFIPDVYQVDMNLNKDDDAALSKCYKLYKQDQDPRVYLSGCLDFCKKYSITSATEIFEGHFGKLLFLYNKISSEIKNPQGVIFDDFDTSVKFDFSFVGP